MTQKFFDNFFPKIEIGGMMGFDRGRHSDGDAGEKATRIHVAGCGRLHSVCCTVAGG
jgi:hypothetical protein